ncbi:hypothetical protein CB0940_03117 [Cercospora beticola]|uniref:gamma-glutamylcyclotransferase n=1 Tax=Cercospora beticola TaxID=122368 RepID=A0A2G5I666_CERBT|nr:hypothetical protein CB0940_03117 [Cercospora beticola]PIA99962.1 hypothetical protein CB0940_03117 [Cercospora beticola]WPB00283.1 hypothetical protein RHO25_004902 [Cercospora beticola]CAK1361519.1 unnamed protein product [Cercospora beticola]
MYPPSMARPAASKSENIDYTKRFSELYFGYASNLAHSSIKGRCPDSLFCGLARLEDYKWHINDTGFGNIVPSKGDHVYGALVFLSPRDEAGLDESEGVPWLYQKHSLEVERINADGSASGQKVQVTTYVDVERTEDGVIDRGYVVWIVKAIREASAIGMPKEYVEKYLRPWLPESTEEEENQEIVMVRVMRSKDAVAAKPESKALGDA